jgi:hypothetical protein
MARSSKVRNAPTSISSPISWSFNNRKLAKLSTIGFGIPAGASAGGFNTCPSKGICSSFCYAKQGFYTTAHVSAARERNLAMVRGGKVELKRFERIAVNDLRWLLPDTVRVHDSGDFFSQDYLNAWYRIARALPTITFYAYTKQFEKLDVWTFRPANFRLVQSVGGKDDAKINYKKPHARVFVTHRERIEAGYEDGTETDQPAIDGVIKIGLVYHGSRDLKDHEFMKLTLHPTLPIVESP